MVEAILFDVNGTLLDMAALDPLFARLFGDASARGRWFGRLQVLWMTTIATDAYRDFPDLASAALAMLAEQEGVALGPGDPASLIEAMEALPPYPDVAPALARLRGAGLRIAALTNGTRESARSQLENAGLGDAFDGVFSVDEARRYKPAPEPYKRAARRLDLDVDEVRLVAAHAWDIAGARAAGLATAFVARPGQVLDPLGPGPDLKATGLAELATKIIEADRP